MTPILADIHERSKRFHAEIARRASLVPQREERTYSIPNTPFGVKKERPMLPVRRLINQEPLWWHCMWMFDLVTCAPKSKQPLTIANILQAVSIHYGMSVRDILSERRTREIVRPRQICYYLAKKLTGKSLPAIGHRLGGRDHTSILSGIRKIEALRKTDERIEADVRSIAASLGGLL